MSARNSKLLASSVMILLVFAAACAGEKTRDEPTAAATADAPVSVATRSTAPATSPAPERSDGVFVELDRGGVMVVGNLCLPFDPAIDIASSNHEIYEFPLVREIHAGLTRVSTGVPATVELDLAETFSWHDDYTRYRFKLRKNLVFSDGGPITANSVKWSWERALRLSTAWSRARSVLGNIKGAEDVIKDGERIREEQLPKRFENPLLMPVNEPRELLTGVIVVDSLTLEIALTNPDPNLPDLLSDPVASVLRESNVASWPVSWTNNVFPGVALGDVTRMTPGASLDADALPVGSGPFRLIAYSPAAEYETCAIARNEFYWEGTSRLEGVIFVPPDAPFGQTLESAFASGRVDYVLPPFEYVGKGFTSEAVISISQRPPFSRFLALNPNHAPLNDVETRRALLSSNDLAEVYAPIGVGWPNSIVPHRLSPDYQSCDREPYVSAAPDSRARLSANNGSLESFEIEFWTLADDYLIERVQTLFEQWNRSTGVKTRIRNLEYGDSFETLMEDGDLHVRLVEVSPKTPSLESFFLGLVGLFGGASPHDEWAAVEDMILDASQDGDEASRRIRFREIECHLYDKALVLPMVVDWIDFEINTQPWVNGFAPPTFGVSVFKEVWLDESAPVRELPWK